MNRHLDALNTIEAALAVAPQDLKSLNNKGYILTEFKQNALAANVFQHLLTLNPDYEYAQGLHLLARLHSCDWTNYEENRQRVIDGVRAGKRVTLPDDLVARLEGKSSLGRLGLLIHSTAGFVDPSFEGNLTLELSNVANLPITIYPAMKIGQISFFRLSTPAERPYGSSQTKSKYQGQRGPTASRFFEEFRGSEG